MLDIDIDSRSGILFVKLKGNIDCNTVSLLNSEVTNYIEENIVRNVVFNLRDINDIDLLGINEILYNHYLCVNNNGLSLLSNIPNNILDKLKKTNILKYIDVVNNDLEAIKVFNI